MRYANSTAKKICLAIMILALILSANLTLLFNINFTHAQAYSGSNVSVTNSNFSSSTSTGVFKPTGWTASKDKHGTTLTTGAINVNDSAFLNYKSDYKLDENPNKYGSDDYILMINSSNASNAFGYKSSAFTLEKNSNYQISVAVKTIGNAASIYLNSDNDNIINSAKIENIKSVTWKTYHFYVTTNDFENLSVNLSLWLGTKSNLVSGVAFFDNVVVTQISNSFLATNLDASLTPLEKTQTHTGSDYYYFNLSLENLIQAYDFGSNPFAIDSDSNINSFSSEYAYYNYYNVSANNNISFGGKNITSPGTDLTYNNNTALIIENKLSNNISFSSEQISLLPNRIYKFSVMAKVAEIKSGSAFVKLTQVLPADDTTSPKTETITFTSTSNAKNNNYVCYSIFVQSHPVNETSFKMQIGLGNADAKATGLVSFTNYKISIIPYNALTNASASNSKTIDMTSSYNNSTYFSNSAFNLMENNARTPTDPIYPAGVKSWTHTAGNSPTNKYGIISTKYFDDYKSQYPLAANPGKIAGLQTTGDNNNVLMMHNAMPDTQSTLSSTLSVTANTYYKFSVWVQTQGASGGASVILQTSNTVVLGALNNIDTNGDWQRYDIHFKSGNDSLTVQLKLALGDGTVLSNGYAFFDSAIYTTPASGFENAQNSDYSLVVNLKNTLHHNSVWSNGAYSPYLYSGSHEGGDQNASYGIIDLNNTLSTVKPANALINSEIEDMLFIKSNLDTYFSLTSKLTYSLSAGSYYRFTFKVNTYMVKQLEENSIQYDEDGNPYPFGVSIKLSSFEDKFSAIVSENQWTTYSFYIAPDNSATTSIIFSLGNVNAYTRGFAYFADVEFEKFDALSDYNASLTEYKQTNTPKHLIELITPMEETEPAEEEESKNDDVNIWILIPSLITALAVVIALIGALLKKVKFNKVRFKRASDYDREKTVVKQIYRKQAMQQRDQEILQLNKDKQELVQQKEILEKTYKENMNLLRSLKIKRTPEALAKATKVEKELKTTMKQMSIMGIEINKIDITIEKTNSQAYLLELISKYSKANLLPVNEADQNPDKQ